mgnify:CR=1 FL=1
MSLIDDLKSRDAAPSAAPESASSAPGGYPSLLGAALPPAQGGPSFSDTEMRTLSGGGRPSPYRAAAAKPAPAGRRALVVKPKSRMTVPRGFSTDRTEVETASGTRIPFRLLVPVPDASR